MFGFNIRLLAYLRRAVRAIESLAASQRTLAQVASDEWALKHAPRKPRQVVIGSFDQAEANKRYRKELEALGVSPEEE